MMHLKYKCKVNFVKLPLIWIDLCLKLVFENAIAGCNRGCCSVVNCASQVAKIMLATQTISHQVEYITRQLFRKTRFTRGRVRELKNAHNSVTVQNQTCLYELFWSQRTRKSPPAVMSTSRETPCMSGIPIPTICTWLLAVLKDEIFTYMTWISVINLPEGEGCHYLRILEVFL